MVHHKHRAPRSKTRAKFRKKKRERGKPTVSRMLEQFHVGDRVHVTVEPSTHTGMPFRRFIGKTGIVTGKQGVCYFVRIQDMHADKNILVHPVHLKIQK